MKVLFFSGYSDNDLGDHGILDQHIELLQKPFTPHQLSRKIREIIGGRTGAASSLDVLQMHLSI
jgi:hypothetical protein